MGSHYASDHIAEDHIDTDILTCIIQEPQQKQRRLERSETHYLCGVGKGALRLIYLLSVCIRY